MTYSNFLHPIYSLLHELESLVGDSSSFVKRILEFFNTKEVIAAKIEFMIEEGLKWADIWRFLDKCGWTWSRGTGLVDFHYRVPSKKTKFDSPTSVIQYVKEKLHARNPLHLLQLSGDAMDLFLTHLISKVREKIDPLTDQLDRHSEVGEKTRDPARELWKQTPNMKSTIKPVPRWFADALCRHSTEESKFLFDWESSVWPRLLNLGWAQIEIDKGQYLFKAPGIFAGIDGKVCLSYFSFL